MRFQHFTLAGTLVGTVALVGATAVGVSGQAPKPAGAPSANAQAPKPAPPPTAARPAVPARQAKIPRTLDGKPDFSGIWSAFILTPLQRPEGAKEFLTPQERAAIEASDVTERAELRIYGTVTPPGGKTTDAYNTFWRDGYWQTLSVPQLRTSQIVEPENGRLPPSAQNPDVRRIQEERRARQNHPPQGPEDRPIWTRCVRGQVSGPPLIGTGGSYNNNLQIVQGSDTFAVIQEMNHETQLVALDKRPHPPEGVRFYKGNSRGYWEGDTLVIESTNFRASTLFDGAVMSVGNGTNTEKFRVTERYRFLDPDNILYGFTVEDPGLWTKPWTAEFVIWRMKDQQQLVEYACHEGNRSLEYALSGARALEAQGIVDPVFEGGDEEEAVR
jgi:hypothetical protein